MIKEESGYIYVDKPIKVDLKNTIFITQCSLQKNPLIEKGTAEQIYVGNRSKRFYSYAKTNNFRYCTLSDKYGLVFPGQIIKQYNIHPLELNKEEINKLRNKIEKQIPKDITTIVFYSTPPQMVRFYLKLFKNINLDKFLITHFRYLENFNSKRLF